MAYLALDTSTETLTLAVSDQGQLLGEVTTLRTYNHSVQLMPLLDQMMEDCGIQKEQLEGIVVGRGPGSYTGVRIGVTTAKVLAWTLRIPLIGISTLQAVAQSSNAFQGLVLSLFDARRKRVYAGAFYREKSAEAVIAVKDLAQWVCQALHVEQISDLPSILATGDGSIVYREQLQELFGDRFQGIAPMSRQHVRAAALLEIGVPLLQQGISEDVERFAPEYLQLAQAEANLVQSVKEGTISR
jgi:tRNA threonylcarbamoyladenosine biosynthesis protein TsaB